MSHFDVVCFRFPYVLQRISYCHIGSVVFVVPPTPPPLLLPNKQRTSNSKLTEPYSFMRLSYLTVTRYPVAQAIIITGPLNKAY